MRLDRCAPIHGLLQGCIDEIRGDMLYGWLFSPLSCVRPMIFVDDTPAALVGEKLPRPDVCEALGVSGATGFAFRLPAVREASAISLYGATPDGVFLVERKKSGIPVCERTLGVQMERAADIARRQGAVAVVCWDGAHNPVGRAKVLYDIVATKRPVVLFCYLHEEFGGALWYPLINSGASVVTIPWERRRECHTLIRRYGIAFGTVWISKNRLPSFMLAAAVSHRDTRFLLDMDDDEATFILSQKSSRAAYNILGAGLARELTDGIASRTVVSPTLRERFGGTIVRHARQPRSPRKKASADVRKLAFIGTVRPHKNVLAIAKAVRLIGFTSRLPLEFHVYGDIQPPEYREALEANGVVLRDMLPACHLPAVLAEMDAVITGFPVSDTDLTVRAIAAAQVSAKISDALALGLPVLTPDTPAIADLRDVPGIYSFTERTFRERLLAALGHGAPISLPYEFTLDGAYASFEEAERLARPAPELHRFMSPDPVREKPFVGESGEHSGAGEEAAPALVLVWKQHDAGLYGRRVDQIARSYKRRFPRHRVFLLELYAEPSIPLCPAEDTKRAGIPAEDYADETAAKRELLRKKRYGLECDGAVLKTFAYRNEKELREEVFSFLVRHDLRPDNTVLVLFPIIQELRLIEDILHPYRTVVDIVDNQLGWATDDERRCFVLEQYFRLLAPAAHVVFNAESARGFFAAKHFLDTVSDVHVIPNWYTLPDGVVCCRRPVPGRMKHLFYSGNMNDRLDWELLHAVAKLPDVRLHLAGSASRSAEALDNLLAYDSVVYHGVTQERETLALLQSMDACLVPHLLDGVSAFMNPIKVRMYQAVGIPVFCPDFLHVFGETILSYGDAKDCLKKIASFRKARGASGPCERNGRAYLEATEDVYMGLLASLHDNQL